MAKCCGKIKSPKTNGVPMPLNADGDPDEANYPLGSEQFKLWLDSDGKPGNVSEGANVPVTPLSVLVTRAPDGLAVLGAPRWLPSRRCLRNA